MGHIDSFYLLLGTPAPLSCLFFVVVCLFVSSVSVCPLMPPCPPRIKLSFYVLSPVFNSPSSSYSSQTQRIFAVLCLLPPFTRSTIHSIHSQTIHGNELPASARHSQRCGRRAASLSLSRFCCLSLSQCGERKVDFL